MTDVKTQLVFANYYVIQVRDALKREWTRRVDAMGVMNVSHHSIVQK